MAEPGTYHCDVLVIGSGVAGLTAAITAAKAGLRVLLVEKEPVYGGTTATSGGTMWIPGNRHSAALAEKLGVADDTDRARRYLQSEAGNFIELSRVDTYLRYGTEAVDFLERETELKLHAVHYPDYRCESEQASVVRSIRPFDYQASKLGKHYATLKGQLPQTLFLGIAFGSLNGPRMKNLLRAGTSLKSFLYTVGMIGAHVLDVLRHGHAENLYNGRALVARLAKTFFDLKIPLWLSSPAASLIEQDGRVCGAVVRTPRRDMRVQAARAVVLAAGGYPGDDARRRATYPVASVSANLRTPTPMGNTGDGIRLAESVGGIFSNHVTTQGAWMPVSVNPRISGPAGVWPHLNDRQKPGFICVLKDGSRFDNESDSYHDFVQHLVAACEGQEEAACWLIGDWKAVRRFGIGFAKSYPVPYRQHLRSGYVIKGRSLADLAEQLSIDPAVLDATVRDFSQNAARGEDPAFGRGSRSYDLSQGDDEHKPNPCLAPLTEAPFFAVRVVPGEIGTFAGLRTNEMAQVITAAGTPVDGLYAVGNDALSVFAGAYPGAGGTLGPGLVFGYLAARHIAGLVPA